MTQTSHFYIFTYFFKFKKIILLQHFTHEDIDINAVTAGKENGVRKKKKLVGHDISLSHGEAAGADVMRHT